MVEGVAGFLLKASVRAALCPQLLTARTDNEPLTNAEPILNEILLVPCPDMIVVLVGAVHK
jgi:hypothetical protein